MITLCMIFDYDEIDDITINLSQHKYDYKSLINAESYNETDATIV